MKYFIELAQLADTEVAAVNDAFAVVRGAKQKYCNETTNFGVRAEYFVVN
jgi:hypothetical protein